MHRKFALAAAAALALGATQAPAAELIQNGSFEDTTDFFHAVGWTSTGAWEFFTADPHSGANSASVSGCYDYASLPNCSISQTVGTEAGQTYELSFWANGYSTTGFVGVFQVIWGGVDQGTIFVTPGYEQYKFQLTAASDSTTLEFRSMNTFASNRIDDVSLTALSVPEPSTWALMIAGFGLAGGALRRRHRAVA